MEYKIVIIIPTNGRVYLLERTLKSLAENIFPVSYEKTIVVENGLKEGAESICAKFSRINCEYAHCATANKSAALNFVLDQLSDNRFLIFFDDDIRLVPNTVMAYANAFNCEGVNHFYGGPFGIDYEVKPADYYLKFLPASARGWTLSQNEVVSPYLLGFNWAAHSSHLKKLGGFDDRFGPNSTTGATGQEHDMMLRLYGAGINPFYVAGAFVWHYVPKSRSSLKWALMRKYKNGISEGIRVEYWSKETYLKHLIKSLKAFFVALVMLQKQNIISEFFMLNFLRGIKKGILFKNSIK